MDTWISYEWKVRIAITLIIVCASATVIVFTSILMIKIVKAYKNIRNTRFKNSIENQLNEVISEFEELTEDQLLNFKQLLGKQLHFTWQKQILIDSLIHYHSNLSGNVKTYIKQLFFDFELNKLAERDLKKGNTKMMIRAMRSLSVMKSGKSWIEIIKYINHKRKLIRVEASVALIDLSSNPLFFLDNLKFALTKWQVIQIFKKIKELPEEKLPKFERWYFSTNESVRIFAIDMTARFNQTESVDMLASLLPNASDKVKIQIVESLSKLGAFEYTESLKTALLTTEDPEVQKVLINAIGEFGMDDSFNQLLSPFLTSPVLNVRFEAIRSLMKLDGGERIIEDLARDHPELIQPILDHLNDPLLQ